MTDWEQRYQVGDTPWEKGGPVPSLLEVIKELDEIGWPAGPILVPGCGSGHDVRVLAKLKRTVVGVDISPTAVKRARSYAAAGKEIYEVGDFLAEEWRVGRQFSLVWEHTCFCAIDPDARVAYAAAAAGCLPTGGFLAGVFFLTPYDVGEERSGPPFGVTVPEIEGCFSPSLRLIKGWVPKVAYPGRENREWIGIFKKS